jgi:hypothetical protein
LITVTGSTNGQRAPKERKEIIYRKPQIYLRDVLQKNTRGEKSSEGVTLNVKGEEKEQK